MVFGQIDGYSRLISSLHIPTDNQVETASGFFIDSIREYGVRSRICTDRESEFNNVNFLMDKLIGDNRRNLMKGSSVHNQRIERFWRDVFMEFLDRYCRLFSQMEREDVLDIGNGINMFVLQYIYASSLEVDLKAWATLHNNHGVRREKHKTVVC